MKVWAIARITFLGFLRNRILILAGAVLICIVLANFMDLAALRSSTRHTPSDVPMVLGLIGDMLLVASGFGSLLAAWAAADAVGGDIQSGAILAVMARPVRRWEFLLGKYLGTQLLMAVYVMLLFGFSYLLAWEGGQRIQATPWVFLVYPMFRFAIFSAIALFLATFLHQVAAFACVAVSALAAYLLRPGDNTLAFLPAPLKRIAYVLLPSTGLLSEDRFLAYGKVSLEKITWKVHAIALAHGLDYALVFFLLAVWSFRSRSLTRA